MPMTKKQYEAIARDIRVQMNNVECDLMLSTRNPVEAERHELRRKFNYGARQIEGLAYSLAATFAIENPRFDRARFLAACGVTQ